MSQLNIRKAFDKAVIAMPSGLPQNQTSFENVSFTAANNVPYQVVRLYPATVENPTLGDAYHREVGMYQVVLCYPIGSGAGAMASQAEVVKAYFKRGVTLTESGQEVIINKTPSIGTAYIENNRYCTPIRISYYVNEFV